MAKIDSYEDMSEEEIEDEPSNEVDDKDVDSNEFEKSDEDVISEALDFYDKASSDESENRKDMLEDLEFLYGDQWPAEIKADRTRERRPCLTVNQLPQFVRQVTNDQRHNRPAITVSPVDDGADVDTAELLTGLIRHIQTVSDADVAIDTGFFNAASIGLGYMRIITDYESHDSFNQEIYIKKIANPFSVYFGNLVDYSDAMRCMITEDIPKEQYKIDYPNFEVQSADLMGGIGDTRIMEWCAGDSVRVAEYFRKTYKKDELVLFSDGSKVLMSQVDQDNIPYGITVVSSRETMVPYVEWYKINGFEVMEKTIFPSQYIPVVPIIGEEFYLDGIRHLKGIVRDAKDSQRMYNFWATAQTEMIALAPKAPWVMAEGQAEGYERQWDNANTQNYSRLEYKQVDHKGNLAPPPQRSQAEPPVQAITQARMQSANDLKAVTGMYSASIGETSNEKSGKAILARQQEGDMANYHYIDNLSRSIRMMGKIILDMIPKIYDAERIVRVIGENGEDKLRTINGMNTIKGMEKLFDPSLGKYDVTVTAGPSYSTKRQEAVESMMSLTNSYPQMTEIAGDLIVKNMDWPGAKEISERLRRAIPPQLLGDEDEQNPEQMMAQMQQMAEQLKQINAYAEQTEQQAKQIQDAMDQVQKENMKLQIQLSDKSDNNKIEVMKIETDKELKERELDIKEADLIIKAHEAQVRSEDIKLKPHAKIMEHKLDIEGKLIDQHHADKMAEKKSNDNNNHLQKE